jgi:hypothetical protein
LKRTILFFIVVGSFLMRFDRHGLVRLLKIAPYFVGNDVDIPQTVWVIGKAAFAYCGMIRTVMLGQVRRIGESAFSFVEIPAVTFPQCIEAIEKFAFHHCTSLRTITFDRESSLREIGESAFTKTGLILVSIPRGADQVHESAFDRGVVIWRD